MTEKKRILIISGPNAGGKSVCLKTCLLYTSSEIFWNDVPEAVQTAFGSGEYANWVQDDYYFLLYPLQPMQDVIEVKQGNQKYQLFYSEDGGLMNTVNVTGKDDTIYPPVN